MSAVRAQVDQERCILTGTCESVAPGLFVLDDEGTVRVLHREVPDSLVEAARSAAASCPSRALTLQQP
ncbi:MAG: ferredoxin [Mycobacteriales bacterium]